MAPAYDRPPRAPGALRPAARSLAAADSWATAAGSRSWRARLYRDAGYVDRCAAAAAGLAAAAGVLSTFVAVAASLRVAVGDAMDRGFRGDFVIEPSAPGLTGLPTALRTELAGRAELAAVTGSGLVWAQLGGTSQALPAVVAAEAAPCSTWG